MRGWNPGFYGIAAIVVVTLAIGATQWSPATATDSSATPAATPLASPVAGLFDNPGDTIVSQAPMAADPVSSFNVTVCWVFQQPAQSVGNPPPYANSPIYLYWLDTAASRWTYWKQATTNAVGCGVFDTVTPGFSYTIRAYQKVQSPIARPDAGVVVDAWTPSFFVDLRGGDVDLGTYTLPPPAN
jgi:hypothetical protein